MKIKRCIGECLNLAKVYDVDLNEATRGAGQLMSQFGLSTQHTFDLLARCSSRSKLFG